MSDTEPKIDAVDIVDDAEHDAAAERVAELLQQRQQLERALGQADELRRASDAVWKVEDASSSTFTGLYRRRMMQAFWSVALGIPEEAIDETFLTARWESVLPLCPGREAYLQGMRAAAARVAADRPLALGAFLVDICGADALLMLVEAAAGSAWERHHDAGMRAANVHDAPEGQH